MWWLRPHSALCIVSNLQLGHSVNHLHGAFAWSMIECVESGENRRILDNFHHIAPFVYVQRCKACHNPFLNKCLKKKSCLLEERNLCSFQCMSRSCPDPMCYPRGRHDHVRYKNNWGKNPQLHAATIMFWSHVFSTRCDLTASCIGNDMHCVLWTWEIGQYFVLYIVLSTAMPGDNSFLHRWLLFQIRRLVLCDTWTCEQQQQTEFRSAFSF